MDDKLLFEVRKGIEAAAGIETLLVLTVAALYFAIVPWGVGPDKLMADAELLRGRLEQGGQIPFAVGKAVGELKAVVCLDTLHLDTPASIPLYQLFQEIGRGVGRLLRISRQKAQAGKLVNAVYWNRRSSGSVMQRRGTTFTSTWIR